jgi:hypothetical protein
MPPSPSHTSSDDQRHRSIAPYPCLAPYRPRLTPHLIPITSTLLEHPSPRRPARWGWRTLSQCRASDEHPPGTSPGPYIPICLPFQLCETKHLNPNPNSNTWAKTTMANPSRSTWTTTTSGAVAELPRSSLRGATPFPLMLLLCTTIGSGLHRHWHTLGTRNQDAAPMSVATYHWSHHLQSAEPTIDRWSWRVAELLSVNHQHTTTS